MCSPTRCAFITGRWQQRSGFEWALGYGGTNSQLKNGQYEAVADIHGIGLLPEKNHLPKLLKKAGYKTGAFGKWHLGSQDKFNPIHHGFDEYYGPLLGHCDYYTYKYYDDSYTLREGTKVIKDSGYLTTNINKRAVDFIDRHAENPFFMYVPHMAVHSPYQTADKKPKQITKVNLNDGNRADYISMVEEVDKGVEMIIAKLKEKKIFHKTLFVVSSDNGGAHFSDNAPLFHRKTTLFEGGIRVPCIMHWPEKIDKGVVSDQTAITMDLSKTFLALAGIDEQSYDGINLLPMMIDKNNTIQRTLFWRSNSKARRQKAVRMGKWKYILDVNCEMLFNLEKDIAENKNLFYQHPQIVSEMKSKLQAWEDEMNKHTPEFKVR